MCSYTQLRQEKYVGGDFHYIGQWIFTQIAYCIQSRITNGATHYTFSVFTPLHKVRRTHYVSQPNELFSIASPAHTIKYIRL